MSYKLAIASGKGGTGKTTVSVNLFHYLQMSSASRIQLADCDVEEPNDVIFFSEAKKIGEEIICQLIPEIDTEKCIYCRKCVCFCEFNAMVIIPPVKFAQVNADLCHSCGACVVACAENAISEHPKPIGKISFYKLHEGSVLTEGRLKIGSAMQSMLIRELKKVVDDDNDIVIFDAPPGTSCPVVQTVSDADFVILVAEPTLFGLHDLKLMVELLYEIRKPFGVIVNKSGMGSDSIYDYLRKEGIELLGEVPFNEDYAACYATGNLFGECPAEIKRSYEKIVANLEHKLIAYEGDNYFKW
jgi:MinD superfamily P-loop ATPase